MEQILYQLPDGWEWANLTEVCTPSRKTVEPNSGEEYNYIGLENIESNTGRIITDTLTNGSEINSTKIAFKKGMVLYGKLRPYLNKVAVAKDDGIATTEIIPFECSESINADFLAYFLRSQYFVDLAMNNCSGARMPRATTKLFTQIAKVPITSIAEQKFVVEKLDALFTRIDTVIENLQESATLAEALYVSELNSVFSSGHGKWQLRKLNDVAEVARGKSKHRPRNDKSLFDGEYPFIQTGDVRNAQKYITSFSTTYNEKGLLQSKLWPKDTICLTIAANIGDVAILGMDACFPDSVVGISSSELETDYLYYFLTTLQQQLDSKANAAAQKNINLKILSEIEIPVPTLKEQRDIVSKINAVDQMAVRVKAEISEKITMMQQLKASILDSAFKGEL
ncbi:TPA: restriction endonuclease subunit S [Enterobacter hormaechei subsp. xiangfangensis]|nr:restriction endonuclease subunit S [Enterobacter hormaechei subsp. xiangfangensis]HCM9523712.1 restriction endonuclease subunit S [Enterobacter hormaechei subsp. xiangfangensis]